MNLIKKLNLWKDAGLISDIQYASIIKYEEEHKPKNRTAYTIITLGALVICLGIISLIASNWEYINDGVKLVIDFLILGGISYSIYIQRENNKKWLLEVLIISYFIMILASIGLISQVYNTGGKLYQAFLFWCLITLPLVFQSSGRATTHIWLIAFLFSSTSFLFDRISLFNKDEVAVVWLFSFLPTSLLFISFPLKQSKVDTLTVFGKTCLFWSILGFLSGTIVFSFLKDISKIKNDSGLLAIQGLLMISLLFSILSVYLSLGQNKKIAAFLGIGSILYLFMLSSHLFYFHSEFLDTIFFILIWFVIGLLFHLIDSKQLFEFAIVVIGIRFLVAYFQLFASLALTGIGLIFSGILIIVISVLYIRNRDKITNWIGELI
ncbi:MAG TPA: DUF2157 domain-containing protein [Leptospiraceae bacterium]|nr:DUF2157 domain-containing protein [Leptospiraceae bacterium]HMW06671.1 DUF2157 domain-containing protein [Leptospiraceae bacterium]HMX34115.1 DUF2157 domain-containing protein [Leptospiraceae bacterium]HMY33722.1 DUF2157 domain-containing protein [Leptospiraceae bacterium]HMZ64933.1 DUF2157 domain-containing protein [Leptospiraceae bacterium]